MILSWNLWMSCRFNLRLKWVGFVLNFFACLLIVALGSRIWHKLYGYIFWEDDVTSGENQTCFHVMNKFWFPTSTQRLWHGWFFSSQTDLNHFPLMRQLYYSYRHSISSQLCDPNLSTCTYKHWQTGLIVWWDWINSAWPKCRRQEPNYRQHPNREKEKVKIIWCALWQTRGNKLDRKKE